MADALDETPLSVGTEETPLYPGLAETPLVRARAAGYSWNDIDTHVAQSTVAATAAGYSQPDIDQYLGYQHPAVFGDWSKARMATTLASNPDLLGQIRSADPNLDLSVSPDLRGEYATALLSGAVKGPEDFASHLAAGALDAAHTVFGLDASDPAVVADRQSAAGTAADKLTTQLPDAAGLVDAALRLAGSPEAAPLAMQSLMDHWSDTGQTPFATAQATQNDPALYAKLNSAFPEGRAPTLAELQQPGRDVIGRVDMVGEEAIFGAKSVPEALLNLGIEIGTAHAGVLAYRNFIAPLARAALDKLGFLPEYLSKELDHAPPVKVIDPSKVGSEAVTEVPAAQAIKPVEPAPMAEVEFRTGTRAEGAEAPPQIEPTASPAAKIARIAQLEQERIADNAAIGTGTFFQDMAKRAEAAGTLAPDPAVTELAKSYDSASGLRNFFRDLMGNESGAARQATGLPVFNEAASVARANRDYAREMMIRTDGLIAQEKAHWATQLEPFWKLVNPHMNEWERELKQGPAGDPMNTTIGQLLQYMEGRSAGVALDPSSNLRPVADVIRAQNQAMDARLRQQAIDGVITYDGYIADHFNHQWERPDQAARAFGAGKLGTGGSLKERTLPTYADGIDAGLMPKYTNPLEGQIHYLNGAGAYSHAADLFDILHEDGRLTWRFSAADETEAAIEHAIGRKAVPITVAEGEEPQARMMNLYGNADLVGEINKWLSRGLYANPTTAAFYDRMMFAKNAATGFKLLFPTFHAYVETLAGVASHIGQGMEEVARGQFFRGFANIARSPIGAAENFVVGRKARQDYVNMAGDPVVQLLTEAGLRMVKPRAASMEDQFAPAFYTSLLRKSLGRELANDAGNMLKDVNAVNAVWRLPVQSAEFVMKEVGRFLVQPIAQPFFDNIIPSMKAGASYRAMSSFLDAYPMAGDAAVRKYARQVVGDVDNRLGELNFDSVFWPKTAKHILNLSMLSSSWAYGTYRGALAALGYNLERRGFEWNPRATTTLLGSVAAYGLANTTMQYLHTGQLPWNTDTPFKDALNYRTGATLPTGQPERGMIPAELKEMYDLAKVVMFSVGSGVPMASGQAAFQYVMAKSWGVPEALRAWVTGEDAIGHKIDFMPGGWPKYLQDNFSPIAVNMFENRRKGTGLTDAETIAGVREAPKYVEDPAAYYGGLSGIRDKWTKEEMRRAQKENALRENPISLPAAPSKQRAGTAGKPANGQQGHAGNPAAPRGPGAAGNPIIRQ